MTETFTVNVNGATREECISRALAEAEAYFGAGADLEVTHVAAERVPDPDQDDYDSPGWRIEATVIVERKPSSEPFKVY